MANIAHYVPLLQHIRGLEGGYAPETTSTRDGRRVTDPETLFGLTINNWPAAIARIDATELAELSPNIQRHIREIRAAQTDEDRETQIQEMLRYGARQLAPTSGTHPATGEPRRTTLALLPDANDDDITSLQSIVRDQFFEHYIENERFTIEAGFPRELVPYLADFSVNAGDTRARWTMVKAMREAGLINDADFNNPNLFPYIESREATRKNFFADDPRGRAYSDPAMSDAIIERLRDATPEQIAQVQSRFNTWRMIFYRDLASDTDFAPNMVGWRGRVNDLDTFATTEWMGVTTPNRDGITPDVAAQARDAVRGPRGPVDMPTPLTPHVETTDRILTAMMPRGLLFSMTNETDPTWMTELTYALQNNIVLPNDAGTDQRFRVFTATMNGGRQVQVLTTPDQFEKDWLGHYTSPSMRNLMETLEQNPAITQAMVLPENRDTILVSNTERFRNLTYNFDDTNMLEVVTRFTSRTDEGRTIYAPDGMGPRALDRIFDLDPEAILRRTREGAATQR